jgi:N-formylglutamate amidohydrolase
MPAQNRTSVPTDLLPPHVVIAPVIQTVPFVFCSPHSGRIYPDAFLAQSRLDALGLRKSEDAFVDDLFGSVARLGAPLLAARFPRAFLDVNREPYELDPELFDEPLPDYANTQSVRVAGGLGTVARIVADGEEIYEQRLSLNEGLARIEQLYIPFHAELTTLIESTRQKFGYAVLIDCHSMPSAAMTASGGARPDFVLGDRFGASSDARITRLLRETLAGFGYDVQMNRPYAGGYITEHYGRPGRGIHAVQIELNRGLYLDEMKVEPSRGFATVEKQLSELAERLFAQVPGLLEQRSAAE